MYNLGIKKAIYILAISVMSMQLFNCSGGDGSTSEPTVITWDDLVWDDGSNDPNTLWED